MQWRLSYFERKASLREEAIQWKKSLSAVSYTVEQIEEKKAYFARKGNQLGLIQEFKQMRII